MEILDLGSVEVPFKRPRQGTAVQWLRLHPSTAGGGGSIPGGGTKIPLRFCMPSGQKKKKKKKEKAQVGFEGIEWLVWGEDKGGWR